jgi:GDP-mannose transporter
MNDSIDEMEESLMLPMGIEIKSTDTKKSREVSSSFPEATGYMAVSSSLMYYFCSVSMVLLNKTISYGLDPEVKEKLPGLSIVLFQCVIAVVLVESARLLKIVEYPPFDFQTALSWLPLNVIFVGMLSSGFVAMIYVSVPMITVIKNLTNLITVFGDWYLFGERVTYVTITAILMMTIGAIMAGFNDLEFSFVGYCWMAVNCLCTSSYTLYMRYASTSIKLPRFGMVYYNNLLSAAMLLPICLVRREYEVFYDPRLTTSYLWICNTFAGIIGFYLNFASLWCVSATSATTYAIVGSLNKVPITVLGFVLFNAKMTTYGILYVVLATLGGYLYGYAKFTQPNLAPR